MAERKAIPRNRRLALPAPASGRGVSFGLLMCLVLVSTAHAGTPPGTAWQCSLPGNSTYTVALDLAARFPMLVESCRLAGSADVAIPPPPPSVLAPPSPPLPDLPPVTLIQRFAPPVAEAAPRMAPQPFAPPTLRAPGAPTVVGNSPYGLLVADAASRHGVDPRLVDAVIRVESARDPRARSNKGALGLMQLMPGTARRFGVEDPRRLFEPAVNIDTGTRYLATLLRMFGERIDLALAAYNAGEGAVIKHGFRIPPYSETRNYVSSVMAHFERSRAESRSALR